MKARTIDIFTKLKFAFTKPVLFVRSDKEEYSDFSTFLEITYTIIISVLFIFRLFMYNPATPISGYLFMFPLSILIAKLSIWSGAGIYTYFLNLGSTQKVSYLYIRRTLIPYLCFYTFFDAVLLLSPIPLFVTKLVLCIFSICLHYIILLICNHILAKKAFHTVIILLTSLAFWFWSILRL